MKPRSVDQIERKLARLRVIQKQLRAERRLAVLQEEHRKLKPSPPEVQYV